MRKYWKEIDILKAFKKSILSNELPHSLLAKKGLGKVRVRGSITRKFSINKFSINAIFKPYKCQISSFPSFVKHSSLYINEVIWDISCILPLYICLLKCKCLITVFELRWWKPFHWCFIGYQDASTWPNNTIPLALEGMNY
jgi:hypothetical protein